MLEQDSVGEATVYARSGETWTHELASTISTPGQTGLNSRARGALRGDGDIEATSANVDGTRPGPALSRAHRHS